MKKTSKESMLTAKEEELKKRAQEYEELRDKYLRLGAEFDNARKRWDRERGEVIKFANALFLKDLLIVLDEMEQALKMIIEHKDSKQIHEGLEIMLNNFTSALKKRGVQMIEAKGKRFDPHLHEIASTKVVDEEDDEETVLEEIQKGYLFQGRLLRTAKVIVGVKKETTDLKTIDKEEEAEERKEDIEDNDSTVNDL